MLKAYKPPVYIGQNLYIKPSYIVSIPEFYSDHKGMSVSQLLNLENLKENDQKGKLSKKAITGLRNAINWLCLAAQPKRVFVKKTEKTFTFKINFITLTLPDTSKPINSAQLQKELLNPWLTYMRKFHQLKNYVWRLEFQANGKLHVHITTDTFLHLKTVRDHWNSLLKKNGHLTDFFEKHSHWNPNSTDIHATKSIKNIAGYLAKYMSKKNSVYKPKKTGKAKVLSVMNYKGWYKQRLNFWNSPFNPRPISGRIWSCNTELSQANKCHVHIPSPECSVELRQLMNPKIEYKKLMGPTPKTIDAKFNPDAWQNQAKQIGELYFLKAKNWIEDITGTIKKTFEDTRLNVASLARQFTVFELS